MAAPREGSGMCCLHQTGPQLRHWSWGSQRRGIQTPVSLPRLCQDLVCWAVIPKGHGAQAGTWEREVSAKPSVARLCYPVPASPCH